MIASSFSQRLTLLCLLLTHCVFTVYAQVDLITPEGFETDGEGSRYVSDDTFNDGGCNFFNRTNDNNPNDCFPNVLANPQGSWFWASEDIDEATNPNTNFSQLTLNTINVTGYTSLEVRLHVAVGQPGAANFIWELDDFVRIQYSINGGAFTTCGQFVGNAEFGGDLQQDTNLDGVANVGAPVVTTTFTEYIFSIPVTGTSLQIRVRLDGHDGSEEFAFDQIRVRGILSVNEAPVLANIEGTALTFTEGGTPLQVTNTITVSDVDDTNMESASIAIITGFNSAEDVLDATNPGGLTESYNNMTGVLTLTGSASLATYQTALRSVTYDNIDNINPTTDTRTVRFQVNDGTSGSNFQSRNINIQPVVNAPAALPYCESYETDGEGTRYTSGTFNDEPSCDLWYRTNSTPSCFGTAISGVNGSWYWASEDVFSEIGGEAAMVLSPLIATGLADFDIDILLGVTTPTGSGWETGDYVRIQYNLDNGPWTTIGAFYGTNPPDGTGQLRQDVDLNGVADPAGTALTNTLQNFNFTFNATGTNLNVRVVVLSNATEELAFDNICVSGMAAQIAPTLAAIEGTTLNYAEDDPPTQITNTITVSDPDDTNMDSARVWFCGGFTSGEDVLAFTPAGGIMGSFNPATGVLTLMGNSSEANYQTVLRSVTYQNSNTTNPANHTRQVCFRINDGIANSNVVSRMINVIEVLDTGPCLPLMESFESDGEGIRYHSNTFNDVPNCDFFLRTNTQPSCHTDPVSGINGSWFWASEDVISVASGNLPGNLLLAPIPVTDFNAIQVSILFGVSANAGGTTWENTDNILIQYRMDAGAWTTFGLLQGDNAVGGNLRVDTDNNPGTFGPYGTTVPNGSVVDLTFPIAATGNTLEVQIIVQQDGGTEELVFDNIRINGTYTGMAGAVCNDVTVYLPEGDYVFPPQDSALIVNGSDLCAGYIVLFDPAFLTCDDLGATDVTVYFTNEDGDTLSQCVSEVTLLDTFPPAVFCNDITVYLDGMGEATITVTDVAGSTDLCEVMEEEVDISSFDCDDIDSSPVTVTITVTDSSGNTATCTSSVTVLDTIRPTIMCPDDVTLYLDENCNTLLPDFRPDATTSDNCSVDTILQSPVPGTQLGGHGFNQVVTLTVVDDAGNSSSCTIDVFRQDTIAPVAACQDITVNLDASGNATIDPDMIDPGSDENCGFMSIILSQTMFTCEDIGPNTVTLTITDQAGNTDTCTATVTIVDNIAPSAQCSTITVYLDAMGMATASGAAMGAGSTDACGIASYVLSDSTFDCSDLGPNFVLLTVTDVNGNSAFCSSSVIVADTLAPSITCPANVTVYVDESCESDLADYESQVMASDNCPGSLEVVQSPVPGTALSGHGTVQVVTFTATDEAGNTATCALSVTLQDTLPPVANCMDISINLDAMGMATIDVADLDVASFDNCGLTGLELSQTEFTCEDFGVNEVQLIVTDGAGLTDTCTAIVTVQDPLAVCCDLPVAVCQDITVNLDENGSATIDVEDVDNGSTADCGLDTMYLDITTFSCGDLGDVEVTLTVVDSNGNSSSCISNVTIADILAPEITCPEDMTIECGAGALALYSVAQTDAELRRIDPNTANTIGSVTMTLAGDSIVGATGLAANPVTQVLYAILRIQGEGMNRRLVTVNPSDGVCTSIGSTGDAFAGIAFNADGSVLWGVTGDGASTPESLFEIDVTDASTTYLCALGNGDDGETIAFNPADGGLYHASGHTGSDVIFERIDNAAVDPCTVTSIDISGSSLEDEEAQAITWSAAQGVFLWKQNHASTGPLYAVTTAGVPTLIGELDHYAKGFAFAGGANVPDPNPDLVIASDNCDDITVTFVGDELIEGSCSGNYVILRTYAAIDQSGNISTCVQTLTVEDTTPPEISCPSDNVIDCNEITCLDFDDVQVQPLGAPVLVSQVQEGGVTVTIRGYRKLGIQVPVALFNSDLPVTEPDLGTPNILYGGNGVSETDVDGFNASNNLSLGNLLIIQNPLAPYPDDHLLGDSIVFEFDQSVYVSGITTVDFEEDQVNSGAGVFMYDAFDALIAFVPLNPALGGDNGIQELYLNTYGVRRLVMYFGTAVPGSGAVGNLCYAFVPEEAVITDACLLQGAVFDETFEVTQCSTTVTRAYSASDECGNTTHVTCIITIEGDYEQPEIICPADVVIGCNDSLPAVDLGSVAATDNCSNGILYEWIEDITEGTGCDAVTRRIYRASDDCGNEAYCVQFITREEETPQVQLTSRVFVQAAMEGVEMEARLNDMGYLPHCQPYAMEPFNYTGIEECAELPDDIVDWVLVQLRDVVTMEVISARAALVKEDGAVVEMDGVSPVSLEAEGDWYYISILHRNHMGIVTDLPMDCTSGTVTCDFTEDHGFNEGLVEISEGVYAMMSGDVNGDHLVKYNGSNNDKNAILEAVGILTPNEIIPGYNRFDVNMDGVVKYNGANNDKNALLMIIGVTSPNNVLVGPLHE